MRAQPVGNDTSVVTLFCKREIRKEQTAVGGIRNIRSRELPLNCGLRTTFNLRQQALRVADVPARAVLAQSQRAAALRVALEEIGYEI